MSTGLPLRLLKVTISLQVTVCPSDSISPLRQPVDISPYTQIRSDRGNPEITNMYCTQSIHTHLWRARCGSSLSPSAAATIASLRRMPHSTCAKAAAPQVPVTHFVLSGSQRNSSRSCRFLSVDMRFSVPHSLNKSGAAAPSSLACQCLPPIPVLWTLCRASLKLFLYVCAVYDSVPHAAFVRGS